MKAAVNGFPISVASYGALELGALPVLPEAQEVAVELGLDLSEHRTAALTSAHLGEADLVLGFETLHIAAAVVDGRAARERVYLLSDFVAALETLGLPHASEPEAMRAAVAAARPVVDSAPEAATEIEDPLGKQPEVAHRILKHVADCSYRLARVLVGS